MNRKLWLLFAVLLLVALAASACSFRPTPDIVSQPGQMETQIYEAVRATSTSSAMLTRIAELETALARPPLVTMVSGEVVVVVTATPEPPTATLPSTDTPPVTTTPTVTTTPVATATPTFTLTPTATPTVPTPTVTATPIPCNEAKFEADVTVPDGSTLAAGSSFRKTWRLRNTGSCTWTTAYDVVFAGGDALGGPSAIDLPGNVSPGQVIDISVDLVAPVKEGRYRSNWRLRDPSGQQFGVGKSNTPFYVDIRVSAPISRDRLDFADSYCLAEWTSGGAVLPCPGANSDSRGFVLRIDRPVLESGYVDDEPALLTHPQMITDSLIRGKYPSFRVEDGHKFSAVIGCEYRSQGCDVHFQLEYQIGNGSITTLKTWHEVYDEQFVSVSVDLSSLAGNDVRFILTVFSNGSSSGDRALWLAPRISK